MRVAMRVGDWHRLMTGSSKSKGLKAIADRGMWFARLGRLRYNAWANLPNT
jgi:hypothetical protein